jgi:hypothetical protein
MYSVYNTTAPPTLKKTQGLVTIQRLTHILAT